MERKITENFIAWKNSSMRKPLVVFGARQTGKTTSIVSFGEAHYKNVVHIDFYKQQNVKAAFEKSLNPKEIITTIEALLDVNISTDDTLLFFDEIQACNEALTSLKFFCTDEPNLAVIAAGSLLGVHIARDGSFPVGYVDMLSMFPMDFEEFCWAIGKKRAFELVKRSMQTMTECPVHEDMLEAYRSYLLVGGMPEAVNLFSSGASLQEVKAIQSVIVTGYLADMTKYASNADSVKIVQTWTSLPSQLAKESGSTKFMWKYVASGAKAERYQTAVDWLASAGLVNKCNQISEGESPLKSFEVPTSFKLYVLDTGLLTNEFDAQLSDFLDKGLRTAKFRGGVAENYVMQQLCAGGLTAYYWGQQSSYEVEFVLKLKDGIVPIEVKSGENVRSNSAKLFAKKYGCPYIIHMSTKNFGKTEAAKSIPVYAACLLS